MNQSEIMSLAWGSSSPIASLSIRYRLILKIIMGATNLSYVAALGSFPCLALYVSLQSIRSWCRARNSRFIAKYSFVFPFLLCEIRRGQSSSSGRLSFAKDIFFLVSEDVGTPFLDKLILMRVTLLAGCPLLGAALPILEARIRSLNSGSCQLFFEASEIFLITSGSRLFARTRSRHSGSLHKFFNRSLRERRSAAL